MRYVASIAILLTLGCQRGPTGVGSSSKDASPSFDGAESVGHFLPAVPPHGAWDAAAIPSAAAARCRYGPTVLALPPIDGFCDEKACGAVKGTCVWGGFGCDNVCALLTTDVDKPCSDAAECQGPCKAADDVPKGTRTTGKCARTMVQRGCSNSVFKGVADGYMCAD
jgi:hypothetical protein